ncbi:hypothetical protein F5Y16DRAFT_404394 [Xylariaceae sp. FL0255]|nr:hypothetical protein F5Y16DRAFT_404394 [Xylariaceae sp. FL0255]
MEPPPSRLRQHLSAWQTTFRHYSTSLLELLCFSSPPPPPPEDPTSHPEKPHLSTAAISCSTLAYPSLPAECDAIEKIGRIQVPKLSDIYISAPAPEHATRQAELIKEADLSWARSIKGLDDAPDHLYVVDVRYRDAVAWADEHGGTRIPVVHILLKTMRANPKRSQTLLREVFYHFRDVLLREGETFGLDVIHETRAEHILRICGESENEGGGGGSQCDMSSTAGSKFSSNTAGTY